MPRRGKTDEGETWRVLLLKARELGSPFGGAGMPIGMTERVKKPFPRSRHPLPLNRPPCAKGAVCGADWGIGSLSCAPVFRSPLNASPV